MGSWRDDLARSEQAFRDIVWEEIRAYVGGGRLVSLETGEDDLDRTGGIDGYQLLSSGVRTIAQRTQFLHGHRTFTIRRSRSSGAMTEVKKRWLALDEGMDLPTLVIQAYVNDVKQYLHCVAITRGHLFYEYVFRQPGRWKIQTTKSDGNTFWVIPWLEIHRDNANGTAIMPLLSKDGLGVVARTPAEWFREYTKGEWRI